MKEFLQKEGIDDAIYLMGSVPHEMFLNILSQSLAYIRTPVTDGVCSSVLESLKLKVPVLASENGTRPAGTEIWKEADVESLVALMKGAAENHEEFVARIPTIVLEDNAKKLADDIERICLDYSVSACTAEARLGEVGK
jgi:glycosyltransferase involved in cell wall biosynthesis